MYGMWMADMGGPLGAGAGTGRSPARWPPAASVCGVPRRPNCCPAGTIAGAPFVRPGALRGVPGGARDLAAQLGALAGEHAPRALEARDDPVVEHVDVLERVLPAA